MFRRIGNPLQSICLSLDPAPRMVGSIPVLPWQEGLAALGL
jgi:hypothetical protein